MLLVERYLEAVREHLPREKRNDIVAELGDVLRSQIEDAEAEQGRVLTEDEIAAMLTRYGAPEVVAARYGARTHLIGPAVYPQYRAVVTVMLRILAAALLIALAATAFTASDPTRALLRVAWTGALVVIAHLTVVTLIFARLERINDRIDWTPRWDPRNLPQPPRRRTSIPRWEAATSILMTTFWLLWWTDVLPINRWLLGDQLPLAPAPIWDALTPAIISLMVASIVLGVAAFLRPHWIRFYEAADLLLDLGIIVVLFRALRAPVLIVVTDLTSPMAGLGTVFNWLLTVGLLVAILLVAVSIASTLRGWAAVARAEVA